MPDLKRRRRTMRKIALESKVRRKFDRRRERKRGTSYCYMNHVTTIHTDLKFYFRSKEKENILKNLNECDHQPAADFTPQLAGSHLQENLHILEHRQPGEEPLLRERLDTQGRGRGRLLSASWRAETDPASLRTPACIKMQQAFISLSVEI